MQTITILTQVVAAAIGAGLTVHAIGLVLLAPGCPIRRDPVRTAGQVGTWLTITAAFTYAAVGPTATLATAAAVAATAAVATLVLVNVAGRAFRNVLRDAYATRP